MVWLLVWTTLRQTPSAGPLPPDTPSQLSCETPAASREREHLTAPALHKHYQKTTRRPPERDKKNEMVAGEGKKSEILGPHPSGPPFGAPPFVAPPFVAPPFGAQFFLGLGPTLWGMTHPDPNGLANNGLAKIGLAKIGLANIGLAKIGFGQNWPGQNHDGQKWIGQNWIGQKLVKSGWPNGIGQSRSLPEKSENMKMFTTSTRIARDKDILTRPKTECAISNYLEQKQHCMGSSTTRAATSLFQQEPSVRLRNTPGQMSDAMCDIPSCGLHPMFQLSFPTIDLPNR